ncbi:MAG: HD domain-containing phosphohydrolase [Phycisphaerae bacterium]
MILNSQVPLHRLLLSLSEALDRIHPHVVDHQQRVAYIATRIAREMGIVGKDLVDVFHAAVVHDIGLVGHEARRLAIAEGKLVEVGDHEEIGYLLMRDNPLFTRAAEILRFHHVPWAEGRGREHNGHEVHLASHIVNLADRLERMIDHDRPVLEQTEDILEQVRNDNGPQFRGDCVEALLEISAAEGFWLDATSPRIYSLLLEQVDWPTIVIDEQMLEPIAEMFARLVDATSPWTAVHSAGVTATAVELAKRLRFSRREQKVMKAAGFLHDIGKLAVPAYILDKPGRLSPSEMHIVKTHPYHTFRILRTIGGMPQIAEWAAFHHERLDGQGYPFRHTAEELTLGSRIMAVADVFTAVTEDRPYRRGMQSQRAKSVLQNMADNGALDGDVVRELVRDFDGVDQARTAMQVEYGDKQKAIRQLMAPPECRSETAAVGV